MTSLENLAGQVYGSTGATAPEPNNNNNNHETNGKKNINSSNNRDKRVKVVNALEIVKKKCLSFFVDQLGEPYTAIIVRDYVETIAIGSSRFKDWVIKTCYDYRKGRTTKATTSRAAIGFPK